MWKFSQCTNTCISKYSRVDHESWIFSEASVKRCQQIKTRAKRNRDGHVTKRLVTTFETTKSAHNKLSQNGYLVLLFTHLIHSHQYSNLTCIDQNRPITKTYCKTSCVLTKFNKRIRRILNSYEDSRGWKKTVLSTHANRSCVSLAFYVFGRAVVFEDEYAKLLNILPVLTLNNCCLVNVWVLGWVCIYFEVVNTPSRSSSCFFSHRHETSDKLSWVLTVDLILSRYIQNGVH